MATDVRSPERLRVPQVGLADAEGGSLPLGRPMRVCHIITSLEAHGAQMALLNLLRRLPSDQFESEVVSLTGRGSVGADLEAIEIPVLSLALNRRFPNPWSLFRLVRHVRERRPDLIVGWLYHADLIAAAVGRLAGRIPVVWGIHHSTASPGSMRLRTRWIVRLCSLISHRAPAATVYVAQSALAEHLRMGFSADNALVIPNGVDLTQFQPDPDARSRFRSAERIPQDAFVFGIVGRFVAEKNYPLFVRAAGAVCRADPGAHVVMCGEGVSSTNRELVAWIGAEQFQARARLLGHRKDVAQVLAGLDVLVSSSATEAFSMVLCEAMACGVPCVVTDVGDSAVIVGDAGRVVPPGSAEALAAEIEALRGLTAERRRELGEAARRRIAEHFGDDVLSARYQAAWKRVCLPAHENGACRNGHHEPAISPSEANVH